MELNAPRTSAFLLLVMLALVTLSISCTKLRDRELTDSNKEKLLALAYKPDGLPSDEQWLLQCFLNRGTPITPHLTVAAAIELEKKAQKEAYAKGWDHSQAVQRTIDEMRRILEIKVTRFDPENPQSLYQTFIELDFTNRSQKPIKGFKGEYHLEFKGDWVPSGNGAVRQLPIMIEEGLQVSGGATLHKRFKVDMTFAGSLRFPTSGAIAGRQLEEKKISIQWSPRSVSFVDGTKLELPQ